MSGRIAYLDWITRQMLRAHLEARFVFGDNSERVGLGGQAGAMRGEPNAIGIATKWRPGMADRDFFVDWNPACRTIMIADIGKVRLALAEGRTVYVPRDGLGTGLSQLPTRAPGLYALLWAEFATNMMGDKCPWPAPSARSE